MKEGLKRHDSLLERLISDIAGRYGADTTPNVFYKDGEIDGVRYTQDKSLILYEVKGRHSNKNLMKAHKQLKRAKEYYENIGVNVRAGVYVSQTKNQDYVAKRII